MRINVELVVLKDIQRRNGGKSLDVLHSIQDEKGNHKRGSQARNFKGRLISVIEIHKLLMFCMFSLTQNPPPSANQ